MSVDDISIGNETIPSQDFPSPPQQIVKLILSNSMPTVGMIETV